jgi:predicted enzyme related to lactoylglutathione lyase
MRALILALTAATALGAGLLQDKPAKPMPADVGAGRVAWFDLTTDDLAASRGFYGKLFEWTFAPVEGTDMALEIVSRDVAIGTLRVAEGAIAPHNGVVYVQVADITASCARAKELGGAVVPGFPFDLSTGIGAIALVMDPVGHPVGMYSRTPLAAASPAK